MSFRKEMLAARQGQYSVKGERSKSRAQVKSYSSTIATNSSAWEEAIDVRNKAKKEEFVKTSYMYKSTKKVDNVDPDADLRACMF